MSTMLLLHKQKLNRQQREQLAKGDIVAIQTDDPAQFRLLEAEIATFKTNDLVWALLDAVNGDTSYNTAVCKRLIANMTKLAAEQRELKAVKK